MKFQEDNYFLFWRILFFSSVIFIFGFITNKILSQNQLPHFSSFSLNILIIIIIISISFVLVHSIHLSNRILIFKNIYGYPLKRIELQKIKSRKTKYFYSPLAHSNIIVLGLFSKKYSNFIEVKFTLDDNKTYKINGQILSNFGLKNLNSKIKK